MDWARVKTILIIVFFIVNVFLVVKIMEKNKGVELSSDETIEIQKLLLQNNIKLETEIPSKIYSIPRMKVINQAADSDLIANKIFGINAWNKKVEINGDIVYLSKTKKMRVQNNGQIEYEIIETPDKFKTVTNKETAEKYICDLLTSYNPSVSYRIELNYASKNGYHMRFSSRNNKYEIFNNNVEVDMDFVSNKIIITQGNINFEGYTGKAKKVSIIDALVGLIRHNEKSSSLIIKKISLGYYADVNKNNEIIKYGEADPAWEIETDQKIYIFDGYSGILLKE